MDDKPEKPGSAVTRESRAGFLAKRERNRELGIAKPDIPQAEHPLIMKHPETGREILYISPQIIKAIIGLPREESVWPESRREPPALRHCPAFPVCRPSVIRPRKYIW